MVKHKANVMYLDYRGMYLELLATAVRLGAKEHYGWISNMISNCEEWKKGGNFEKLVDIKETLCRPL